MADPLLLAAVAATFLLAGLVKGVIGLGLPTVSLALLSATIGLPGAMALVLAPAFVTNVWQALSGGHARSVLARIWPFLGLATLTVWIGALALTRVDVELLVGLLGLLLVVYAATSLAGLRVAVPAAHEAWIGPAIGAINGVLTGMTGSFVVPGVMYLQAIGLPRDMLVQAMGLLFMLSTLALGVALGQNGLLGRELGIVSAAAILPALAGMAIGRRVRGRLSEASFRRAFFIALLLLGLYLVADAAAALA